MAIEPNKAKAIEAAISSIERMFGKGAIMQIGKADIPKLETISTGSMGLDAALGIGGVPKGRVIEIYGQESSGKTTLALHMIAEAQKEGGVVAFIDAEHALDLTYAGNLGVNVDEMLISQPDFGEQALEIAETLVRSGAIDIVVIDSVAALVPKAELRGDMGDVQPGAQARLMSQALRKLTGAIHKSQCVVVFINQIRMKIGVMFGSPNTTSGGKALKFYASQRLEVARIGSIKRGDDILGNRTRVKVVKNKVAPPFRKVEFDIYYGQGICQASEILEVGQDVGLVKKSGSWYSIGDERIGQGKENARAYLKEHPKIMETLRGHVRGHLGIKKETPSKASKSAKQKDRSAPKEAMLN